jgi:peptide/nickel transport system permease protein
VFFWLWGLLWLLLVLRRLVRPWWQRIAILLVVWLTAYAFSYGDVLRNAMVPVLTVMGLQFGNLITGAIVIENVFVLPGIGRLIFQAIANRDLIVVRDVVMLLAAMVIVINFCIDVLYAWIDPRIKLGHAGT